MTSQEQIESTRFFEMQCRVNDVPGGWSVDCTFVHGYSPTRRKPGKHTCLVRPGHEQFDAWGGRDDKTNLVQTERYIPAVGQRVGVPVLGMLEVFEVPTTDSPWLRLRRVGE